MKEAGFPYCVIDGTGEALDVISQYPDRDDFMVQGLDFHEIVRRIPCETEVIGMACMFSTLWPLTDRLAKVVREKFPRALMVLGGEHGTAVISFALRPIRVVRTLAKALFVGIEETRYAKWFTDRLFTRRHWRRLVRARSR